MHPQIAKTLVEQRHQELMHAANHHSHELTASAQPGWRLVRRSRAFLRKQCRLQRRVTPTTTQVAFITRPRELVMLLSRRLVEQ